MWRRHRNFFGCLLVSAMLHLIVLGPSGTVKEGKQAENIFVTLEPPNVQSESIDAHSVVPPLDEDTLDEVKRMLRKAKQQQAPAASVHSLCVDEKVIMGIGVKLSFSSSTVISAPEYLPAFISGIREGDIIDSMTMTDLVADVKVRRSTGKIQYNIPVINLCGIVKEDF